MELTVTSIMWIGLTMLILSILYMAYLIDRSIEKRRNSRIWYVYNREANAMISGPYTKGKAESMLKLYLNKEEYVLKKSKSGYPGKDKRKFELVKEVSDGNQTAFTATKFLTIKKATEAMNELREKGIVSYIVANFNKWDIIRIIIVATLYSYKEILKEYWNAIKKATKEAIKFVMGSVLCVAFLFGSTLLTFVIGIISLFSKSIRDDIATSYIEEEAAKPNKGESKAPEGYFEVDAEL